MLSMSKPLAYGQKRKLFTKRKLLSEKQRERIFLVMKVSLKNQELQKGEEVTTTKYLHLLQGVNPINGEALLKNSEDPKKESGN